MNFFIPPLFTLQTVAAELSKERTPVRFKNMTSGATNVIGPDELVVLVEGKPKDRLSEPFRKYVDESIKEALKKNKPGDVEQWKEVVRETVNKAVDGFFESHPLRK